MGCCGQGSHSHGPEQNNNLPLSEGMEESEPKDSALKKAAVWGLVLIVIAGLIYMLI